MRTTKGTRGAPVGAASQALGSTAADTTLPRKFPRVVRKPPGDEECNICGSRGDLSEDHVPPECCLRHREVEIRGFWNTLGRRDENVLGPTLSQSGVRYRTICQTCNNDRLGKYDAALKEFGDLPARVVDARLTLRAVDVECRPRAVMQAVAGHLLAAKSTRDSSRVDAALRRSIMDPSVPFPENIHLLFWLYPFDSIRVLRDTGVANVFGRWEGIGICSILKFFPVAFMLVDGKYPTHLPSLDEYRDSPIDRVETVKLPWFVLREGWPETPSNDGNVIIGAQAIFADAAFAKPRRRRR